MRKTETMTRKIERVTHLDEGTGPFPVYVLDFIKVRELGKAFVMANPMTCARRGMAVAYDRASYMVQVVWDERQAGEPEFEQHKQACVIPLNHMAQDPYFGDIDPPGQANIDWEQLALDRELPGFTPG